MAKLAKFLQAAAGNAGGAGLDIDEVFSTYLYTGDGTSNRQITTNINTSDEGGLVWIKNRDGGDPHVLFDTERGSNKSLSSNTTGAEVTDYQRLTSFRDDGFRISTDPEVNASNGDNYASWTFRKAPKFFDVVTFTNDGNAQTISHNLGSVPGMIIMKRTDAANNWAVYHRSSGGPDKYLYLNTTASVESNTRFWDDTDPTSTEFTIGNINQAGTYVAYLFAHNDGDGEFGPDGDADVIKCGSYTGNGSTDGPEIDLGFEPQWVLIKEAGATGNWQLFDSMRGMVAGGNDARIAPNVSSAEDSIKSLTPTATGFKINTTSGNLNTNNSNHIYMAIRRGPLAVPEDATEVFAVSTRNASEPAYTSGFPVDFAFARAKNVSNNWDTGSRLQQGNRMFTNLTNAEASNSNMMFDYQEGWSAGTGASTNYLSWMWKRAPGYFDVVAYSGNSTAGHAVSHNLGVAPEMMWVKARNLAREFVVYHKDIGNNKAMDLETATAAGAVNYWNYTTPIDTVFTVGDNSRVNDTGYNYIAYLFASAPGVSKVGSYTGNGTSQTIDCGFTSGARFVLIKRATGGTGNWMLYDTVRGITTGSDPVLKLNNTDPEENYNHVQPNSSGFSVTYQNDDVNNSGDTYIFYAIA